MRVIAGTARGARLKSPKGRDTRPTLDRVREALFSILGELVEGANFLDLYAGTGAVGIEALSRGADSCVFVENDRDATALIGENLATTKLGEQAVVIAAPLPGALRRVAQSGRKFEIVYIDPPYAQDTLEEILQKVGDMELLEPDATVIIESDSRKVAATVPPGFEALRKATYGNTCLSFYGVVGPGEVSDDP